DRLHQRHRLWNHPRRASALAGPLPLTRGSHQDVLRALPAITEPVPLTLVSPLDGGRHCSLDQVFAQRTSGTRHYETTVAFLDQAAPAFSLIRLTRCPLFFCTNDQNSSICTWLKCRSLASTCVRAAAWVAARHAPLANRLIFVSGDLFGRPQAASAHHDQQGL